MLKKYSIFAILIFLVALAISIIFFILYGLKRNFFIADPIGYYMYLPSYFIYNNIENMAKFSTDLNIDYGIRHYLDVTKELQQGKTINQYTYGMAFFEAPFFLLSQLYLKIVGGEMHGYTFVNGLFQKIASIFYSTWGLFNIFCILKKYFDKNISLIVISILLVGTNLFWYTTTQLGMPHNVLFFLYSIVFLFTYKLFQTPNLKYFLILSFAIGFISLIRPTDIIVILIPLLWNVTSFVDFKNNFKFLYNFKLFTILSFILFFIIWLPQFLLWKKYTGSFLYYSYGNQSFDFLNPQFFTILIGPSNSTLFYSPILIFSFLGLFLKSRFNKLWFMIICITLIYIYIISCWFDATYAFGLGCRPMVHIYPILAIPIAVFFNEIKNKKFFVIIISLLSVFFIARNVIMTFQLYKNRLLPFCTTYKYNNDLLFKTNYNYSDLCALETGNPQRFFPISNYDTLYYDNFNKEPNGYLSLDTTKGYPKTILDSLVINPANFNNTTFLLKGNFKSPILDWNYYYWTFIVFQVEKDGEKQMWKGVKVENKIGNNKYKSNNDSLNIYCLNWNQWGEFEVEVDLPKNIKPNSKIAVYFWNGHLNKLYIDDLFLGVKKNN